MEEKEKVEGMLSPYRVLDLTDEKGLLCGKLLGDLGADVIKVERPGGDPVRSQGPFYHDEVDPEKSLLWFAFNTSKRGITLDIETAEGQEIFKRLVKGADFVVESFDPGYLDKLGLGYSALEKVNPGLIMVSITPFGQTGPYKDYKAPDIVAWALGGVLGQWGEADRPPIWIAHHSQLSLHAAAEAAAGALMALYYRGVTGEGQQVDLSIQDCATRGANLPIALWQMMKLNPRRARASQQTVRTKHQWPCKDGYVYWAYQAGLQAKRQNVPLIQWMDEEGVADDFIKEFDWDAFDLRTATQETIDRLGESTIKFFMMHTKAELLEGAVKRRVMLYPVATTKDILENVQLAARSFWVEVEHPELGAAITYPGAFTNASETPPRISRRAPLIGEHNEEVYEKELGISREELLRLKQAEVI
jgi:crotonobetainyl-CoA:carnitine CoA-transferase CaiB-like acyl-CoA transferase